jgi:hypothetical protein
MIGADDLRKIVALALCSDYVSNDKPLSILLISDRPEAGKTQIVKGFYGMPKVEFASDLSAYGLKRDFAARITQGTIRHIIIPEFLQPLMRGKVSAQSFVTTLQAFMEDGVMGLHTGFLKASTVNVGEVRTVGVIACMPRQAYSIGLKREWTNTGFLSRWLVVSYKYSDNTVESIIQSINIGKYSVNTDKPLDMTRIKDTEVDIPIAIAIKCRNLSEDIIKDAKTRGQLYGFRELKHIRSLVMANVIYEQSVNKSTRTVADETDYIEVERLGYLFNEQFNEVRK